MFTLYIMYAIHNIYVIIMYTYTCLHIYESESCSVLSDSFATPSMYYTVHGILPPEYWSG